MSAHDETQRLIPASQSPQGVDTHQVGTDDGALRRDLPPLVEILLPHYNDYKGWRQLERDINAGSPAELADRLLTTETLLRQHWVALQQRAEVGGWLHPVEQAVPFLPPSFWAELEDAWANADHTDDEHTPLETSLDSGSEVEVTGQQASQAQSSEGGDEPAVAMNASDDVPLGTEPDSDEFEGLGPSDQLRRFFNYIGIEAHGVFVFTASFESQDKDGKWRERWTHRLAQRRGTSGDARIIDCLIYGSHTPSYQEKGTISSWRKKKGKDGIRHWEYFLRTAHFSKDSQGRVSNYSDVRQRRTYFVECDGDAGSLKEQRERVRQLAAEGLIFNALIYSGGKSLHLHLTRPSRWDSTPEQDRWIDQALCLLLLGDTQAQTLNQACRLPGSKRPGKLDQRLIGGRAQTYASYEELRSLLQRLLEARGITDVAMAYADRGAKQARRFLKGAIETAANSTLGRQWNDWDDAGGWSEGQRTAAAMAPVKLSGEQMLDLLPLRVKQLVLHGSESGNRWADGTTLTLNLRGAADVLTELGLDVDPAVTKVLDLFCENSGGDVDRDRLEMQYDGAEGALPGRSVESFMNSLHFLTGGQLGERKHKALSTAQRETALGKILAAIGPGEWGEDENGAPVRPDSLSVGQFAEIIDDLGQLLRWNEMRMAIEYENDELKPHEVELIYVDLHKQDRYVTKNMAIDALLSRARKNGYDPARDYLDYLKKNDAIEPVDIDNIATDYLGTSDPLYDKMMKVMLLGAVDRRMRPGCKFDYVVVLKGEQGTKKSTFWQALASPDMHTSSMPENDKDMLLNIHAVWIYELAELESITSKHDVGKLKNYITTPVDLLRVPYGKASEWRPRASVFVGTVNGDSFLRDETGDRRFLVIDLPQRPASGEFLNIDAVVRDRDRIWKAALLALEAGDKPYLNHEDQIESDIRNEDYQQVDAWEGPLDNWLNPTEAEKASRATWGAFENRPSVSEEFTTADALVGSGLRDMKSIGGNDNVRMAKLLKRRGFVKTRKRINGKHPYVWRRPEVA